MAELEAAIYTRLAAYEDLIALTSTRIYPLILPQEPDLPAVTYQRIDGPREYSLSSEMGLAHPRIQIDSWGKTYASVKLVAMQVYRALERWADAGASPAVLDSVMDDDEDTYESDTRIYRVRQDWVIWHRE